MRPLIATIMIIAFVLLVVSITTLVYRLDRAERLDPLELESLTRDQIIARAYEVDASQSIGLSMLLPSFGFFGILVGAIVAMLFIDDRKTDSTVVEMRPIVRNLLSPEERAVFDLIESRGGMLFQSEVTSMPGFTKVKAHRVIASLEDKQVVSKTESGKQRVIRLNEPFDALAEDR